MSGFFSRFADINYWLTILLALPGILIGLTFHEFAHAWMANRLGDPTAKMMGRLTLNPLKHLNLIGTLALIFFRFGWAKPVPINPDNFRDRRKGTLLVSIAGPGANLLLALLLAALFRLFGLISLQTSPVIAYIQGILGLAVFYNLILAFFNIIPIPPLDGSQILFSLLPLRYTNALLWLRRYGFIILLVLIFTRVLWYIIGVPSLYLTAILAGPSALGIIL
ncbi:hypothetical protein ES703_04639 [subsurface metagenome]|nr:site-2 protease family protein [bacterium]